MNNLNRLFRERIGFPLDEKLTFERLDTVLELAAKTIPFENIRVISGETAPITGEDLTEKILNRREGGLCYEINSLLYLFLVDNGFDVVLTRAVVYNLEAGDYYTFGRTHATILLTHGSSRYIVDSGFGGNLPMKPVPLDGETVSSSNGEFRIGKESGEAGNYVLELRLKHKDQQFRKGYAFYSDRPITDVVDFDEIQTIIVEHPDSTFNKKPLLSKLTDTGSLSLTDTTFTRWENGVMTKEQVDKEQFERLKEEHFIK
ncbi:arylamine N-acetyltransferase [Paenibacillus sp. GCM10027627]|uniref:arylamine N-acetyltransferase family protein n=1 Tax=unclassified Paenibacillus TaxID=185978 RepID=UPI0036377A7B